MKRAKNELLQFLGGLAMLVVGLFLFSQKVMVSSSFFGGVIWLGGFHMTNGMVIIPFIIGIVWLFASGGSFASKVFTGLGVLLLIATIILTTNISMVRVTLYEWIIMLVLIFGGAGLLARILLSTSKAEPESPERDLLEMHHKMDEVEKEIERLKREK
ncbi:MAG: hypothetical protein NC318_13205 [Blautia sp.]|nr:hypothetical protein [Lachnoclostridium sp.]MCM1212546.1 hypothetical protein [Blautia sp.]